MTAIDITDSPMPNHAKPMWPIGSFTISRTAAWHDRQSLYGMPALRGHDDGYDIVFIR
jgi:hypothetical protein